MRHATVAVFVPHLGCPHRCSFCDQREISGAQELPTGETVRMLCETAAREPAVREGNAELAFFGGSFTAIKRTYLLELLEAAAPFVRAGIFRGIRISTRPDAVGAQMLELLAQYGVRVIELGAQSMNDGVLQKNGRGHTAAAVEDAAERILAGGFELGLQMMTGLYGSDDEMDFETARRLAALSPDSVRVYPTIVMENTALAELFRQGEYRPQRLEEAVELGGRLLEFFGEREIPVIRMGLHAQPSLEAGMLAGPYHPAFRELCEGRVMERRAGKLLSGCVCGRYVMRVAPNSLSKILGHGARTVENLAKLGYHIKVEPDAGLSGLAVKIEEV